MKVTFKTAKGTLTVSQDIAQASFVRWLNNLRRTKECATTTVTVHQDGAECDHEQGGPSGKKTD